MGSFRVFQPSTRTVASHEETIKEARKSAAYWTSATGSTLEIQERFPSGDWVTVQVVKPKRGPSSKTAHSTIGSQKIPSFKISTKDPTTMTAGEINKELDKLDAQDSTLGDLMIEAGRGHERPSEYLKMTDPLSTELRKNADRRQDLRIEVDMRYGPRAPSRLPTGRGFGPRSKSSSPTRGGLGFGKRYGGD